MDAERLRQAVRLLLEAIGEDPEREGLRETPRRVAQMYQEVFSGLGQDPLSFLSPALEGGHRDPVLLTDIPFSSFCEHHLLPFFGTASIGYIPDGSIVGTSKIVRALEALARRPQVQERLTRQMADALYSALKPDGVAVLLSAEHLCLSLRGVKRPGHRLITTAVRGDFRRSGLGPEGLLALLRER